MRKAYLSLGANLGERGETIREALRRLALLRCGLLAALRRPVSLLYGLPDVLRRLLLGILCVVL